MGQWMYCNREGYPPLGVVVEVWFYTTCRFAIWRGQAWSVDGVSGLVGPAHIINWRPA